MIADYEPSLLTLDDFTLFYYTLSDVPAKRSSLINEWASGVSAPSTQAGKSKQGSKSFSSRPKSTTGIVVPSLIGDSTTRSSATSVLTDNVKIISRTAVAPAAQSSKVKVETEVISLSDEGGLGGLSDNDEMDGEERKIAINSPPKGKRRITSEVTSLSLNRLQMSNIILFSNL